MSRSKQYSGVALVAAVVTMALVALATPVPTHADAFTQLAYCTKFAHEAKEAVETACMALPGSDALTCGADANNAYMRAYSDCVMGKNR